MNSSAPTMYAPRPTSAITQVRVGVGIIITDSAGKILLEKRSDSGWWGLPGGRIEAGESIQQAAIREAKEETGLDINIVRLLGVYSEPQERVVTFPDNVVQLVDIVLAGQIIGGRLTRSAESQALKFFDPANLPAEIVPPAQLPLQDFCAGQLGVVK